MSIGIIGAGAIGLFLASTISKTTEVSLYIRRDSQKVAIEENGIHVLGQGYYQERLQIKEMSSPWEEDLIILAVKQPALESLLNQHQTPQHKDQALLFIQNGMSHLGIMKSLNYAHVFIGVVEHGIRKENDYTIDWRGMGRIRCGCMRGDRALLNPFLRIPGLQSDYAENWLSLLEDKLLANAVINGLTSLYRVENGQLFTNPHYKKMAYALFLEVAEVLAVSPESLEEKWTYIEQIGQKTAFNRSSMLQDLEAGRQTEVDAILGYILKRATSQQMPRSLPLTSFVYESIKGMEL